MGPKHTKAPPRSPEGGTCGAELKPQAFQQHFPTAQLKAAACRPGADLPARRLLRIPSGGEPRPLCPGLGILFCMTEPMSRCLHPSRLASLLETGTGTSHSRKGFSNPLCFAATYSVYPALKPRLKVTVGKSSATDFKGKGSNAILRLTRGAAERRLHCLRQLRSGERLTRSQMGIASRRCESKCVVRGKGEAIKYSENLHLGRVAERQVHERQTAMGGWFARYCTKQNLKPQALRFGEHAIAPCSNTINAPYITAAITPIWCLH